MPGLGLNLATSTWPDDQRSHTSSGCDHRPGDDGTQSVHRPGRETRAPMVAGAPRVPMRESLLPFLAARHAVRTLPLAASGLHLSCTAGGMVFPNSPTPRVADLPRPPTFACGAYGTWTSKLLGGVSQEQVAPDWEMNGAGGDRRGARGAAGTAGDPQGACDSMRTSSPPVPLGSIGSNVLPARSASKGSGAAHAPAWLVWSNPFASTSTGATPIPGLSSGTRAPVRFSPSSRGQRPASFKLFLGTRRQGCPGSRARSPGIPCPDPHRTPAPIREATV